MGRVQLTKGARALVDQFAADLADIRRLATEMTLADLKFNPYEAHDILREIEQAAERAELRVKGDLEPMLQRQESKAELAKAVTEAVTLTDRVAALEEELTKIQRSRRILPFKQKRGMS